MMTGWKMTKHPNKVFIDSNMIIFAARFQKANIFQWINRIYDNIYIHVDVYYEILDRGIRKKVDEEVNVGNWHIFDPRTLSSAEQAIYKERMKDVGNAFGEMNNQRIADDKPIKTVSNIGEIATITACMMIGARIICSNDFDIRTVVEQEDYRILVDGEDVLIVQDSAEDFCVLCYQDNPSDRSIIRKFYKSIIAEAHDRKIKLAKLDSRL